LFLKSQLRPLMERATEFDDGIGQLGHLRVYGNVGSDSSHGYALPFSVKLFRHLLRHVESRSAYAGVLYHRVSFSAKMVIDSTLQMTWVLMTHPALSL
jgi:hypothetical protein